MISDYYTRLGINEDARPAQIHRAYRILMKRYHPDITGKDATKRYHQIQAAYKILMDEESRRLYDHKRKISKTSNPVLFLTESSGSQTSVKWKSHPFHASRKPGFWHGSPPMKIELEVSSDLAKNGGKIAIYIPHRFDNPELFSSGNISTSNRINVTLPPNLTDSQILTYTWQGTNQRIRWLEILIKLHELDDNK